MKNRKLFMIIGIAAIISSACLCSGLNSYVERLPFNLKDLYPEQIATSIVEQLPVLETQVVEQFQQLKPGTDQVEPSSQLEEPQSGLQNLKSYHSQLVIELTGEDENGNTISETNRFIHEIIRDQQASHTVIINESKGKISQWNEIFAIDGDTFLLSSDSSGAGASCVLISGPNGVTNELNNINLILPTEMITDVGNGNLVKKGETVNGIKTDHFGVNQAAISGALITSGKTDFWISQADSELLVRMIGKGVGEMTSMTIGAQITGDIIWQYDLLDVNQIKEIVVPQACLDAAQDIQKDIPILENAEELTIFGQIISYKTQDKAEDVVNFYKTQMDNNGYALTNNLSFSGLYNLTFSKDGKNINIAISNENEGGSLIIILKE